MKKHFDKWGFLALIFVIFVLLQKFYAYHFFYIEQFQLFTNTHFYFIESWSHPGGGIEYLSNFLLQFFILPFAGPTIVTLLTSSVFLILALLLKKLLPPSENKNKFFLIPATIAASYLLLFLDFNYYLQGNLAFAVCLLMLLAFSSIKSVQIRAGLTFAIVPALYWFAGSISFLFALSFFILELQWNGFHKKHFYWILLPLWAVIVSILGVRFAFFGSYRMSFLPDLYYQRRLIPDILVYLPWVLLILGLILISLFQNSDKKSLRTISFATQIIVFASIVGLGFSTLKDRKFYQIQKLDYFARNEQWNKIIQAQTREQNSNYLIQNYVNLALVKKGLLLDQLFERKQHGTQGLKVSPQNKRLIAPLLSDIDYCVGDIASSQQYAFEGNQTCRGAGSGRLLKRLAETAIIFDNLQIAEKYLITLKHTWHYREWALEQETAIASSKFSAEFESKKSCLPKENSREFAKDFQEELKQLCADNPDNKTASSYLQASYLLSKDLENLSEFRNKQSSHNRGNKTVPKVCQQALLAFHETKPESWTAMGITTETINLYNNYKSFLKKHYRDTQVRTLMEKQFGTTYWFYLQFNDLR
ncbi:DUF6057 family protein [Sunxiuqinia sp. A32]|uniref:DUF6057 family protein n=1 Tax=Sunxiuqinia sp. A32 TaxID=3461496 RepID=UPI004045F360